MFTRSVAVITTCLSAATADVSAQRPMTWTLSADPVVLGEGPNELFESLSFGKLREGGGAVLADNRAHFIRSYSSDGEREWSFGRSGDGPGEFRGILGLWLGAEGIAGVWDGRSRRITTVRPDGTLASTARVEDTSLGANLELFLGAYSNGDAVLGSLNLPRLPGPGEVATESWRLGRFAPTGKLLAPLGEVQGLRRMYRAPYPFSPIAWIGIIRDSMVIAEGYEAAISIAASAAKPRRAVRLPFRGREAGNPMPLLEAELKVRNREMLLDVLRQGAYAEGLEELPHFAGLIIDADSLVWIKEYNPRRDAVWLRGRATSTGPGGTWHVLDPSGEHVATLMVPDTFLLLDVRGDLALGVQHDEYDVQHAVIHRIER